MIKMQRIQMNTNKEKTSFLFSRVFNMSGKSFSKSPLFQYGKNIPSDNSKKENIERNRRAGCFSISEPTLHNSEINIEVPLPYPSATLATFCLASATVAATVPGMVW